MIVILKLIFFFLALFVFGCGKIGDKAKFFQAKHSKDTFFLDQRTLPHKVDIFRQNILINPWSTETFTQRYQERKVPIDILWVIDDSQTMRGTQNSLANNFQNFIEKFVNFNIDFKMAIITTTHANNIDAEGKLNTAFLKSDKKGFIDYFTKKAKVGIRGSSREKGLHWSMEFLKNNPNWIESDNYLVIVYVSDENDISEHSHSHYVNWMETKKGDLDLIKIYSIVPSWINTRYKWASEMTGGLVMDIDKPFDHILDAFLNHMVKLKLIGGKFKLNNHLDISKINNVKVFVNDTLVDSSKWIYSDRLNNISFVDDYSLADGSEVRISYPDTRNTGELLNSFTLSESVHEGDSSNITVRVNNIEVSADKWNIDNETKTITFSSGFVPGSGAEIEISYRPYRKSDNAQVFELSQSPDMDQVDNMAVFINGNEVDSTYWSYESQTNSIIFQVTMRRFLN